MKWQILIDEPHHQLSILKLNGGYLYLHESWDSDGSRESMVFVPSENENSLRLPRGRAEQIEIHGAK